MAVSSGYTLRLGLFTAINPWHCAITITYNLHVCTQTFNGETQPYAASRAAVGELKWKL